MSHQVNMNAFLYSLLVTLEMNDFTLTEARDALLAEHAEFTDEVESRKFIYRQLARNIEKGFITRADCFITGSKKVIYSKTEKFYISKIVPITRNSKKRVTTNPKIAIAITFKADLKKELASYKAELDTVHEEAKEYKRLSVRFPELHKILKLHQSKARYKSIQILGKVHALQNLLGYTVTGHRSC